MFFFTYCSISQHHSPFTPEIYSIPLLFTGSFAVSFGDHGWSGIICGTVCMFKSGKLKLSDFHDYFHLSWWPFYLWTIARGYWLFVLIVSFSLFSYSVIYVSWESMWENLTSINLAEKWVLIGFPSANNTHLHGFFLWSF